MNRLFTYSGIITEKSFFRNNGAEQIDGAFEFQGWYYLVECKWTKKLADGRDLDGLSGQVGRSARQTMGLFFSINGWSKNVPKLLQQNPNKSVFLMNGDELEKVLKGQINLREVLIRKLKAFNIEAKPFLDICNE